MAPAAIAVRSPGLGGLNGPGGRPGIPPRTPLPPDRVHHPHTERREPEADTVDERRAVARVISEDDLRRSECRQAFENCAVISAVPPGSESDGLDVNAFVYSLPE